MRSGARIPRAVLAFSPLVFASCGGSEKLPLTSSSPIVAPAPDGGVRANASSEAPASSAEPAPPTRKTAEPAVPPALPATMPLARKDGSRSDAALALGDAAFERDDFAAAEASYREAATLSPKDPAPIVGLPRRAVAKTHQ